MTRTTWLACAMALGCATPTKKFPTVRFADAPPSTLVNDRRNVAPAPAPRLVLTDYYAYMALLDRQVTRKLELPRPQRARGTNSIDEVPDSTWFTNRGTLTVEQMRSGPVTLETPELHFPWTIESTQIGGTSIGFIIRDNRGVKYLLKFDEPAFPEVETGTDVVVNRLLWACGYNVPEDQIVYLRPDQLLLAQDAVVKDTFGHKKEKLIWAGVTERLSKLAHEPDGRIRGVTSRWLSGKALGDPPSEGVRPDDPNDVIPHELRRDLRGMYPVYAWLDMVDIVPGNFIDMYVADPATPNVHYVKHYALDFGRSLGTMGAKGWDLGRGYINRVDWYHVFFTLGTLGIIQSDFERRPIVDVHGVAAVFAAKGFQPGDWKPDLPYIPFKAMDQYDGFWGAKIVARFSRAQIHAAVEAGRYTDPRAVEYITDTLVERQRKTAAYWYSRVAPLERFEINGELCFDDLGIAQGFAPAGPTRYAITPRDPHGTPITAPFVVGASADGHTCTQVPPLANGFDNYTIYEIRTTRPQINAITYVHVARATSTGVPRVIGLYRM